MPENKLIHEKSPYLLQHAHNPVNWYPWGAEAFENARQQEKPVFLSIGYSTCHWCHVMERESFEDLETAALLNRDFVAVKVDREERPDIDAVYMAVCQAMTGAGGWPLTILMTPEKKPFYAGTYLPKHGRGGLPGLMELLPEVSHLWRMERDKLLQAGDDIAAFVAKGEKTGTAKPDMAFLAGAATLFQQGFDRENGGFGRAPKFPAAHNLLFLLRYGEMERSGGWERMAETTLTQMAKGGLFDQIGGGFSRYSTDDHWLVPHFEKMLYDNTLLAYTYLEAYRMTKHLFFRSVAKRTLDYVLRELTGPEGGFYCGQDADSGGVEGSYYVFTPWEVEQVLGREDGAAFCHRYGITPQGNFEGKSIPNRLHDQAGASEDPEIDAFCEKLYAYRLTRMALHKDDKCLASWNALMLAALGKAYRTLGETHWLTVAKKGLDFFRTRLIGPDGRLFVRWRDGESANQGQLEDYAFYAWALLELYAAEFEVSLLVEAARIARRMTELFYEEAQGGFFLYAADGEQLISRPKEVYDGAMPSGNSAAALVLTRLARLTGEPQWLNLADKQLSFLGGHLERSPTGHSFALLAMAEFLGSSEELVVASATGDLPQELLFQAEERHLAVVVKTPENARALAGVAPFTEAYPIPEKGQVYYYCKNGACQAPVTTLKALF